MATLCYGDNLDILRRHLADASVDLVSLDPPLNSAQNYNAGKEDAAAAQIQAFEDTGAAKATLIWLAARGIWGMDPPKAYDRCDC